ncbi:MAG: cytochrome c maturation protein CcmE [Thermoplasmata archaeon]|nr:cytochrome c maturation protein CcmE [Thermoplasmata archaeon]
MTEEVESDEAQEAKVETEAERPRSRLTGKRKKLLTAVAVLVIIALALVVGFWGNTPVPYMTVSQVIDNSNSYVDKEIEIKGFVENWNSTARTFDLTDEESVLSVSYDVIPDGFNNGKEIVVSGVLKGTNGVVLEADKITVGCPSKY